MHTHTRTHAHRLQMGTFWRIKCDNIMSWDFSDNTTGSNFAFSSPSFIWHTFRCGVIVVAVAQKLPHVSAEGTLVVRPFDVESISAKEGKRVHAVTDAGFFEAGFNCELPHLRKIGMTYHAKIYQILQHEAHSGRHFSPLHESIQRGEMLIHLSRHQHMVVSQ